LRQHPSLPFLVGIGRLSHRLGAALAEAALPRGTAALDLGAALRSALLIILQLAVALTTAVVVVAVTQPFLPSYPGPILLIVLVAGFGIALWQSATNLEGHVRAGSQAIVEALTTYARSDAAGLSGPPSLTSVHGMLRASAADRNQLDPPAVWANLADLNLRGRTGATVLAIIRAGSPSSHRRRASRHRRRPRRRRHRSHHFLFAHAARRIGAWRRPHGAEMN
jgi:CPA2 family monovalent cation:H+ antiporter-2